MDEDTFKWRVPFRMGKNVHKFEVRLGPPGGDKVGHHRENNHVMYA